MNGENIRTATETLQDGKHEGLPLAKASNTELAENLSSFTKDYTAIRRELQRRAIQRRDEWMSRHKERRLRNAR